MVDHSAAKTLASIIQYNLKDDGYRWAWNPQYRKYVFGQAFEDWLKCTELVEQFKVWDIIGQPEPFASCDWIMERIQYGIKRRINEESNFITRGLLNHNWKFIPNKTTLKPGDLYVGDRILIMPDYVTAHRFYDNPYSNPLTSGVTIGDLEPGEYIIREQHASRKD